MTTLRGVMKKDTNVTIAVKVMVTHGSLKTIFGMFMRKVTNVAFVIRVLVYNHI